MQFVQGRQDVAGELVLGVTVAPGPFGIPALEGEDAKLTRTGAIVAGAGGVLVITGLIAWLRGPSATSTPSASISRDGTMVGWAGRF